MLQGFAGVHVNKRKASPRVPLIESPRAPRTFELESTPPSSPPSQNQSTWSHSQAPSRRTDGQEFRLSEGLLPNNKNEIFGHPLPDRDGHSAAAASVSSRGKGGGDGVCGTGLQWTASMIGVVGGEHKSNARGSSPTISTTTLLGVCPDA